MECVFVNGGVGFIGHHLCMELKKNNYRVIAIDNMQQLKFHKDVKFYKTFINERIELLKQNNIEIINLDTIYTEEYIKLMKKYKPKFIYHMSAIASARICRQNPGWAFSENLVRVEQILENIRVVNSGIRLIYASSSVAYGEFSKSFVTEDTPLKPINIYGLTKKNSEDLIKLYNSNYGVPYTIIRPSALYGPRCVNLRVSQIMIENALENKPITLFDKGAEKLAFTYVDDTVQGFLKAGTSEKGLQQTFNITYGKARPVKDLTKILKEYFPDLKIVYKKRDKTMPKRGTLIINKARKMIGYNPLYPVETGYPKYIEWYISNKEKHLKWK